MFSMGCVFFLPLLPLLMVCGVLLTGLLVYARNSARKSTSKPYVLPSEELALGRRNDGDYDIDRLQDTTREHSAPSSLQMSSLKNFWLMLRRIPDILAPRDDLGNDEDDMAEVHETGQYILKEGLKDNRKPQIVLMLEEIPETSVRY